MIGLSTLLSFAPTIMELINGKKAGGVVLTKGLIRSKTANFAHAKVVGGVLAIYAMELPQMLFWGLVGVLLVDWAANLILRFMTREPV